MKDRDYAEFVANDSMRSVGQAVLIYAVALGSYWLFVA
jgi:hypothetical protein